jgi:hypothetical protein
MPSPGRLVLTLVAALTAGAITAGCDSPVQEPTVTKPQAIERVTARAQEALQQLPPGATLKAELNQPDVPCDSGPKGRTFVEIDYKVEYPDGWPVEQFIPTLADYWTKNGYKTLDDNRDRDKLPTFGAEHPDGFRIGASLTYRDSGRIDAYLVSSSPCL